MVLIIGAQEPITANMILTTSHPKMTFAREAALLQLGLPNGPVRLWTDSIPYKSPVLWISSYSCPRCYLTCWLGLVCTGTGMSLIPVPMESSHTVCGAHQHLVPSIALPEQIILDYHNDPILLELWCSMPETMDGMTAWVWKPAFPDCGSCHVGQQMMVTEPAGSWCLLLATLQSLTQQNQKNLKASSQWKVKMKTLIIVN